MYVIGLLPYLYALKKDQVSIVMPLYQLIPVFSYLLALIFLNEQLNGLEIMASLLIISGAIFISIDLDNKIKRFKLKVFWLMALSSFLVALNGLVFKYFAIKTTFWTTSFWEYIGLAAFAFILLIFVKSYRRQFFNILKQNRTAVLTLNGINEVINIIAKIVMNFATILTPLALAWVINGFQPFFVLVFGILLAIFFPKITDETLIKKHLIQKIISISIMFIGVYLLSI